MSIAALSITVTYLLILVAGATMALSVLVWLFQAGAPLRFVPHVYRRSTEASFPIIASTLVTLQIDSLARRPFASLG